MHEEIVHGVEIVSKVIIQDGRASVRRRIECSEPGSLLGASYIINTTRRSPVYQAIVEGPTVGRVDWWIGQILRQRRRVLIEIDDQLRKKASRWRKLCLVKRPSSN